MTRWNAGPRGLCFASTAGLGVAVGALAAACGAALGALVAQRRTLGELRGRVEQLEGQLLEGQALEGQGLERVRLEKSGWEGQRAEGQRREGHQQEGLRLEGQRQEGLRLDVEHLEVRRLEVERVEGQRLQGDAAQPRRRDNLAQQQLLHWELLSKAVDDPHLAEALDAFEAPSSPTRRAPYLFANSLYTNQLFAYRVGNIDRQELFGFLHGLLQNPIVREYWHATRHQRGAMADGSGNLGGFDRSDGSDGSDGSDEAALGRVVDDLLQQLEDAEGEEWWVVGEPGVE
ncbi:DUF6082 family protein [Streptomyces sp. NPDC094437]|uniref:DUF6082 family protein n=1 Tax=Streptomyces sp. NPDC094437 TaxID=3366060 RepID=UPI0038304981